MAMVMMMVMVAVMAVVVMVCVVPPRRRVNFLPVVVVCVRLGTEAHDAKC